MFGCVFGCGTPDRIPALNSITCPSACLLPPPRSIPFASPDDPHAGLPRPLHEALATAILTSIALSPAGGNGSNGNGSNGNGSTASASLSSADLLNYVLGNGSNRSNGANGGANGNGSAVAEAAATADAAAAALAAATAGMSYSQTSELLAWVMDRAEVLRRKVGGGGWRVRVLFYGVAGLFPKRQQFRSQ